MFTNNAGIITLRAAPAQHIHFKTNSTSRYTPRLGRGSSDSNANAHTWSCWQYRELQLPTGCAIWCGRHNLERGERENRGEAHKFITSGSTVTLPGFFRGASAFLSRHTPLNLQRFTTKGYFLLKKMSILLAKQSLRTSKMATRNTSSSDALLDKSSA